MYFEFNYFLISYELWKYLCKFQKNIIKKKKNKKANKVYVDVY